MKIILATGIFPPDIGGPAIYTEGLALELKKLGLEVKVVTYSDSDVIKSKIRNSKSEANSNDQNSKFPPVRISRRYPKGLRHFLYFWSLLRLAKNADVIYAQNLVSAGLPAALVSKILRKKFVLKSVGDYAWEQGTARWGVKENLEDFQNKKYGWKIEWLRKIQKWTAQKADKIIVPSFYLKKIISGWQIPDSKIEIIYNAVEPIKKIGVFKKDCLLSIGRFVPWKGFDTLVEIMPELWPEMKLIIIGNGPEYLNIKAKVKDLGLENRIELPGSVPQAKLPGYFARARIFVLNSDYEGLSHTILEAMQAEIPIIATNVGGNPELIENGKNGILVEYQNREQLKEAILKLWSNEGLQNKFIQNSHQKLKEFSWENLVEKTLKVLESI